MRQINLEYEVPLRVGRHQDIAVVSAQANKVGDEYKATVVVKAKNFNRSKTFKSSFCLVDGIDVIQQLRDFINAKANVASSLEIIAARLITDFPTNFPEIKMDAGGMHV